MDIMLTSKLTAELDYWTKLKKGEILSQNRQVRIEKSIIFCRCAVPVLLCHTHCVGGLKTVSQCDVVQPVKVFCR